MRPMLVAAVSILLWPLVSNAATITSLPEIDGMVGQPLVYKITADNAPTSFSIIGLSATVGLKLDKLTGLISGTPKIGGSFSATISANGSGGTATLKIAVIIAKIPVSYTSANNATGALHSAFKFQFSATISSPKYSASGLPNGLRLGAKGIIGGTPTAGGVFAPLVTISNKTMIATELLSITITGGTTAPKGIALTPSSGVVGVAYSGVFTATGAAPVTFAVLSGFPPGVMTTNANLLSGTPTSAGTYQLNVAATNSAGTTTAILTFVVAAPSQAPIISSPLAVSGEVANSFTYVFQAASNAPVTYAVDPAKLPRGLAQDDSGNIVGYPFDPGVYSVPVSAANVLGADMEILTITVASLAPGNTFASIKFADNYHDAVQSGFPAPTSSFNFNATVNAPGIGIADFNASLNVDVTVGIYEFSGLLGDSAANGKFKPGKSAVFNFTDIGVNGKIVKLGNLSFTLLKHSQIRISARRKGTILLGGVETLRAEQLVDLNKFIGETIPVKIQIGPNVLASFYMQSSGTCTAKLVSRSGFRVGEISTVRLRGGGSGSPSN